MPGSSTSTRARIPSLSRRLPRPSIRAVVKERRRIADARRIEWLERQGRPSHKADQPRQVIVPPRWS
jgi:hypothetical protein